MRLLNFDRVNPRGRGRHALERTLPLFKPYRWKLLFAGLFIVFVGFCVSTPPMFTKLVIDKAIPNKQFSLVLLYMGGFVLLMALRMASWYAGQSILLIIREQIIFDLRSAVFSKLQELCMRFHQKYSPGFLFDRALGGASTSVGVFLTMFFNTLIVYFFTTISAISFCLKLNVALTLWVLVMSAGYIMISRHFSRRIHKLTRDFNLASNKFAGQVTDLLRGVKTIKAFAMEQRIISEFDENLWPLQMRSMAVNKESMYLHFFTEGLGYFINAAVIVGGAALVLHEKVTLGTLVAFTGYQSMLIGMFAALASVSGTYSAAMAGLEQMYEVLDEEPTVKEKPGATMPASVHGEIEIEDLHFAYDDKPIIKGISLHVAAGQSIALVGPSGGGKSTLTNLLLRFYDPEQGTIRLDGHDIRTVPLAEYRSLFGVVLQDPFLFNDSIYNNLKAVKPDATDAELRTALERAQAWGFVSELKDGWHYVSGESGTQLSGGQRQRIAIARCFLTNPRIMVLDEATSALDNQSERLVQQALNDIMSDRTVFVIAHRLSTVRNVDRILVIVDGHIAQDGAYDELSQKEGVFRDMLMASLQNSESLEIPLASEQGNA